MNLVTSLWMIIAIIIADNIQEQEYLAHVVRHFNVPITPCMDYSTNILSKKYNALLLYNTTRMRHKALLVDWRCTKFVFAQGITQELVVRKTVQAFQQAHPDIQYYLHNLDGCYMGILPQ